MPLEDKDRLEKVLDIVFHESEAYADFFTESNTLNTIISKEGKFQYVNQKWVDITGFSKEELCAVPFFVFIHPDDLEKAENLHEMILKKKNVTLKEGFCCRFRKVDGTYQRISFISASVDSDERVMITALPLEKNQKIYKNVG